MKINFIGWYGRDNLGDEAFKLAHAQLFPGAERVYTVDVVDPTADLLILGGGDVVKSFYLNKIPAGMPYYALGVGLGYDSEIELLKKKPPLQAYFRNHQDKNLALNHGIQAEYAPDLTFIIDAPKSRYKLPNRVKKKSMAVILTDSINASHANEKIKELSYAEYFKWELASSLDDLSEWYQIYFVLYSWDQYSNDLRMAMDIVARMSTHEAQIINRQFSIVESIDLMKKFDLVLSMKFHGLIFSTIAATPFVNIGMTKKTENYCLENRLDNLTVPPRTFTYNRLIHSIKEAEAPGISDRLQTIASDNHDHLISIRDRLAQDWLSSKGDTSNGS
jgi:polysaccharide pyruvyl transferase WcaK-like protein